jgi:hypothetical protein
VQRAKRRSIAGHHAAPESDVDMATAARRAPFGRERGQRGRRGNAVERHVDQGSDAAGGRGARGGRKTFPESSAWLIDVYVRIDQACHHDRAAGVVERAPGRRGFPIGDGGDAAAPYVQSGAAHALRSDHALAANY